jgi:hypothetical protein
VCTKLARSKTFGKIKRRRCCGIRAKVSWGMSNIVAQQGKNPFKDETIDDRRCRRVTSSYLHGVQNAMLVSHR